MHHTLHPGPTQHALEALCAYGRCAVLHLGEKRKGPEHPYGIVDQSYANFRECPKGEVRRIPIPRTPVNKGKRARAGITSILGMNPSPSASHPLVETFRNRLAVVVPPLSVIRYAHLSVRRRQPRSHLCIYLGDRFFVYRCIWDVFGEPMVVLCGYAIGDQPHRLLLMGCSFRNYQVVSSLQVLIPLNLDRSSCVDLLLYPPIPSRGKRHLTVSELLL